MKMESLFFGRVVFIEFIVEGDETGSITPAFLHVVNVNPSPRHADDLTVVSEANIFM